MTISVGQIKEQLAQLHKDQVQMRQDIAVLSQKLEDHHNTATMGEAVRNPMIRLADGVRWNR